MRISDWSSDVCSSDLAHLIAPKVTLTPEHLPYGAGSGEGARRAGEVVQLRLRVIHPIGLEPSAPLFNAFAVFGGDCLAHCPVPPSDIGRAACRDRVGQYV